MSSVEELKARIEAAVENARRMKAVVTAAEKQRQEDAARELEAQREREADKCIPQAMVILEKLPELLAKAELDGTLRAHLYTATSGNDPMMRALTRLCRQMGLQGYEFAEKDWWNTFHVDVPGYEND